MRFFIPGVVALAVVAVAGCVHRVPVLEFGPEGRLTTAEEVLARVDAQGATLQSLKGDGKLGVDAPQARGNASMLVAVAPGGRLHLETLDFFGRPIWVLVCDGARFGLYQAQEGRYYTGPASPQNLARFLPVMLTPQELEALLLGRAPRLEGADPGRLELDAERGAYRLTLARGTALQTLWVDTKHLHLLESRLRTADGYDVVFGDFRMEKERLFAHSAKLRSEAAKTTLTLTYGSVALNPTPENSLFTPRPPANVPVVEVNGAGAPQ